MKGHREQEYIQLGQRELLATALMRRFEQIGETKSWERNA